MLVMQWTHSRDTLSAPCITELHGTKHPPTAKAPSHRHCLSGHRHPPRTTYHCLILLRLPPSRSVQHISSFIDWLCGQLRRPSNPTKGIPTATSALAALLQERGARQLFLRAGGVMLLAPLLKTANTPTSSQLLYELCLCVWQMTYVKAAADQMAPAGELIDG